MNKKIDYFNQLNGLSTFSVTLNYAAGVEKPRYINAAYQTINKSNLVSVELNGKNLQMSIIPYFMGHM